MKKTFALIISSILIFSCLFGCSNSSSSDDTKHIEVQNEEAEEIIATEDVTESVKEPVLINWEASLNTPEVADDVKAAFREIGEKPEYIVSAVLIIDSLYHVEITSIPNFWRIFITYECCQNVLCIC